jgi:hypothetical protein
MQPIMVELHIEDTGDDGGAEVTNTAITNGEMNITAGNVLEGNPSISDDTLKVLAASVLAATDTLQTIAGGINVEQLGRNTVSTDDRQELPAADTSLPAATDTYEDICTVCTY